MSSIGFQVFQSVQLWTGIQSVSQEALSRPSGETLEALIVGTVPDEIEGQFALHDELFEECIRPSAACLLYGEGDLNGRYLAKVKIRAEP